MLTDFGFVEEHADLIFGCSIADYNIGSLKAFLKNGYRMHGKVEQSQERKATFEQDVVLSRDEYAAKLGAPADGWSLQVRFKVRR